MKRCVQYVRDAVSMDGTLDKEAHRLRFMFFVYVTVGCAIIVGGFLSELEMQLRVPVTGVGSAVVFVFHFYGFVNVLLKRVLTMKVVMAVLLSHFVVSIMWDLASRVKSTPQWPLLVVLVDMLLVLQVPQKYSSYVVWCTVAWLLLMGLEESFRFGLFDMPGLLPQGGDKGRREHFTKLVDCETLPCPVDFPPVGLGTSIVVFIFDFFVTRGFAREVLKEQEAMQRTIATVQDIASLLAGYDVEGVARMLEAQETLLPEEMRATLQTLEENLRKYRPYLPAALFEEDEVDGVQRTSVAPPGLETETATIVFTDIRASTSIWECAPDGMRAGLKIHNRVMREVMQMFGGYEVKTIGDAFMIAFETTADGVNFALQVHEKLLAADWPASLLEDAPICTPQHSLWGGLTVRIGVNTGLVTVEQNTLTGRTDYLGHTVNVASRLESTCKPGAVAVPSDLWTSDCGACSGVVGHSEALDLKGVSGATFVCPVWPVPLVGRRQQPLCEAPDNRDGRCGVGESDSVSLCTLDSVALAQQQNPARFLGTVGVADLAVGDEEHVSALQSMSSGLSTLTVALDQSGGSLVTLLGSRVCVSWNVTRSAPAHMENAIRFAQRMSGATLAGAGLASGPVQHGDVGARKQRFVTVMGTTVRRSWTLCEEAVRDGVVCLFEPPEGTTLPTALEHVLLAYNARTGVYKVVYRTIRDSVIDLQHC